MFWLCRHRLHKAVAALFANGTSRQPYRRMPLEIEELEDRAVPAVLKPTLFSDGLTVGTLREAVIRADTNGQDNAIELSAGTYTLSLPGRGGNEPAKGDLDLNSAGHTITIEGAGADKTIINAQSIDRVFQITGDVTVILRGLTVTGGLATDGGSAGGKAALGGGIMNNGGNVTLDHAAVKNNVARGDVGQDALGGGIYTQGGSLSLTNVSVIGNSALGGPGTAGANGGTGADGQPGGNGGDGKGGGIYVASGVVTIRASVITNNTARGGNGGNGGHGGHGTGTNVTTGPAPSPTGPVTTTSPAPVSSSSPAPTGTSGVPGSVGSSSHNYSSQGGTGASSTYHYTYQNGGSSGGGTNGGGSNGGGFSSGGGSSGGSSQRAGGGAMGGVGGKGQGGGIYLAGGILSFADTHVTANSAVGGNGGNGGDPGISPTAGTGGNGGNGGDARGGGLFLASGNVDLGNLNVTGNTATGGQGGIAGAPGLGSPTNGANGAASGDNVFNAGASISHVQGNDQLGVVRPDGQGSLVFSLDTNGNGTFDAGDQVFHFGYQTDHIIIGDWNGTGYSKIGVVRPDAHGNLVFSLDTNGDGRFDAGDQVFTFGHVGDTVVIGDWNGDGKDKVGVVRPDASGNLHWYLDTNGDGSFDAGDQSFVFGHVGQTPVVGDWNGAGRSEIGVVGPSGPASVWTLDTNGDGKYDAGDQVLTFGAANDHFVIGDWNGAGKSELGVYRQDGPALIFSLNSTGTGQFGPGDQVFVFGAASDTVIIGHWTPPGFDQRTPPSHQPAPAPSPISDTDLLAAENEAISWWSAAGLDAAGLARLRQANVQFGALPNGVAGYTVGSDVTLSGDAAGYGWYDDAASSSDPFVAARKDGSHAAAGSAAAAHMDLATVLAHEYGHVIGLPDIANAKAPGGLMDLYLAPGVQRLPGASDISAYFALAE